MFKPLKSEAMPYRLEYDRNTEPPHTLFHLLPQTAEETQAYLARYGKEARRGTVDDEIRAARLIGVDKEILRRILVKVENAYTPGDALMGEETFRVIDALDYASVQELIRAAQSMSALEDSAKNS